MRPAESICYHLNRLFRRSKFKGCGSGEAYAAERYRHGENFLACFGRHADLAGRVLDVGSGRGGLVQWLARNAAQQAVGLSRGAEEVADSRAFTRSLGIANCHTVQSDAHAMGLAGGVFDAAVLVDAMEHFANPERVLAEVRRALRPGGRACIRFNPWHFRSGHHLTRHIRIPWVHLVFGTDTLLAVARRVHEDLERELPAERLKLVGVPTREEYDVLLNRITFGRFLRAIRAGGWRVAHLATTHACGPLGALAKRIPGLREPFLKRILCVLEKTDDAPAQDAGGSPDGQPADGQPPAGVFRPW